MVRSTQVKYFDSEKILSQDYDIFVVQNLETVPMHHLLEIFPKIRQKAKTVLVLHEGYLPQDPNFYKFEWDAITCFDERYKKLFGQKFPQERIHIIPYPCHPVRRGDKQKARAELNIPQERKMAFSFGRQRQVEYLAYLFVLKKLSREFPLKYIIVRSNGPLELDGGYKFVEQRMERPPLDKIYKYLHAADVFLLPKFESQNIVVSSTVFLRIGSLTPFIVPETSHTSMLQNEVIKYRDVSDLKNKLIQVFKGERAAD